MSRLFVFAFPNSEAMIVLCPFSWTPKALEASGDAGASETRVLLLLSTYCVSSYCQCIEAPFHG